MTMSVEPLSPALGAEIKGVDLRRPLDDATVKAINAAFDQHVVVVFRDQDLSDADQRAPPAISAKSISVAVRPTAAPPAATTTRRS